MGEHAGAPREFTHDGMSAEIVEYARGAALEHGPAERDIIYIVLSGYGVLGSGSEELELTNGDVLFVAAGTEPRFPQLSRKFKAWKLQLR